MAKRMKMKPRNSATKVLTFNGEPILGELVYEIDIPKPVSPAVYVDASLPVEPSGIMERGYWKAFVTSAQNTELLLWFQVGDTAPQASGVFKHGKALVKYAKEAAAKQFGTGASPVKDTLSGLASRRAGNVVPGCFGDPAMAHRNCSICPYREDCKLEFQTRNAIRAASPGREILEDLTEDRTEDKDTDTDLFKRIQEKLANKKWEN